MSDAVALVNPILWTEPFGLSVLEAGFRCTPVVSFTQGAMPEVIEEGVTGFLVDGWRAMAEAIPKTATLSRERVHESAVARFSVDCMVDRYAELYRRVRLSATDPLCRPLFYYLIG